MCIRDRGYVVRLYVARIDMEESDDCRFDSITVFDGGKFWSTRQHLTYIVASRDSWRVVRESQVARSRLDNGLDGSVLVVHVFSGPCSQQTN